MEIKDDKIEDIQIKLQEAANFIRENSSNGRFTKYDDLLLAPFNIEEDSIGKFIYALRTSEMNRDIAELQGERHQYLYSRNEMTDNYATMVFRREENDILKIIAETVRDESRIYPRPTNVKVFHESPFNFEESELTDVQRIFKSSDEYKDIQESRASNGAICLYSSNYLTKDYAEALTEWLEVTQYETP